MRYLAPKGDSTDVNEIGDRSEVHNPPSTDTADTINDNSHKLLHPAKHDETVAIPVDMIEAPTPLRRSGRDRKAPDRLTYQ